MARIRSLKADSFLDDGLSEVSLEAHFLLLGLPCLADREGRLEDRPVKIAAQLFPYRREVNTDAVLSELVRSGHIVRYTGVGGRYIQINDWARDQRPHQNEPPSAIPPPPQNNTDLHHFHIPENQTPIPETMEHEFGGGIGGAGYGVLDRGSGIGGSASSPAAIAEAMEAIQSGRQPEKPLQRPLLDTGQPEAPPEGRKRPAKAQKPSTATDAAHDETQGEPAPHRVACDMLCRVYEEVRGAKYGFGLNAKANGKLVRELLWGSECKTAPSGIPPVTPLEEIERRWRIGLAWDGYPRCDNILALKTNWDAYATPQATGRRADVTRGVVRAEDMVHNGPGDLSI
jgi:hypothetical protein